MKGYTTINYRSVQYINWTKDSVEHTYFEEQDTDTEATIRLTAPHNNQTSLGRKTQWHRIEVTHTTINYHYLLYNTSIGQS